MVNRWLGKVTIAAVLSLPLLALTAPSVFAERNKISVLNNSGKTMTALHSGSSDDPWGENLLDGPLPDRGTFPFEWDSAEYEGDVSGGCVFDVRATYSDGTQSDLRGINFCTAPSINFSN
ncbi:hypothetical protein QUA62_14720 [Microcoleus sp. MON1_C1]|uniref:hypothetical protein n=1 Tax=Microcoleus sp. MON1_C1 TaxID=2818827 RepID=UPI002FD11749